MFVDKDSLIINGVNMGQYITEAEYQYNKLWAKDSGRNLAGTQVGTLIGIFPKIVIYVRRLTKEELHILAPIFDSDTQTVKYYDDNKGQMITMKTYTGDWAVKCKSARRGESFNISFISRERRK